MGGAGEASESPGHSLHKVNCNSMMLFFFFFFFFGAKVFYEAKMRRLQNGGPSGPEEEKKARIYEFEGRASLTEEGLLSYHEAPALVKEFINFHLDMFLL